MMMKSLLSVLLACVLTSGVSAQTSHEGEAPREGGLTGTGIVGEITALGSIIVNDLTIDVAPELLVSTALGAKRAGELVPGDVVAVAVTPENEGWTADAVSELHPLIGPVSDIGQDNLTVLGVTVASQNLPEGLKTGDWVAISGFWAPGGIEATRVQSITPQATVSIQGSYRLAPNGDTATIGSIDLKIDPLRHAHEGDVIRATGTFKNGSLAVTDVTLGLFDRPVSLVLAEGYLTDVAPSGHYTVAGSGLSSYTDNLQADMTTERITVCGINGRLGLNSDPIEDVLAERLGCHSP